MRFETAGGSCSTLLITSIICDSWASSDSTVKSVEEAIENIKINAARYYHNGAPDRKFTQWYSKQVIAILSGYLGHAGECYDIYRQAFLEMGFVECPSARGNYGNYPLTTFVLAVEKYKGN